MRCIKIQINFMWGTYGNSIRTIHSGSGEDLERSQRAYLNQYDCREQDV
jgi:hypothetical protein